MTSCDLKTLEEMASKCPQIERIGLNGIFDLSSGSQILRPKYDKDTIIFIAKGSQFIFHNEVQPKAGYGWKDANAIKMPSDNCVDLSTNNVSIKICPLYK